MSDDKLRNICKRLLDRADHFTGGYIICERDRNDLYAALCTLDPEEPLTINDLTVEQRMDSLNRAAICFDEMRNAVADHFRQLYKAYAEDTLAIHVERETTEESLRALQVRHEPVVLQLADLHSRFSNWVKTFYEMRDERDQLRPAVEVLQTIRDDIKGYSLTADRASVSSVALKNVRRFFEPPTPDSSVHEASDGGSGSCEHTKLKRGDHCLKCGKSHFALTFPEVALTFPEACEPQPPADSAQEESGSGSYKS